MSRTINLPRLTLLPARPPPCWRVFAIGQGIARLTAPSVPRDSRLASTYTSSIHVADTRSIMSASCSARHACRSIWADPPTIPSPGPRASYRGPSQCARSDDRIADPRIGQRRHVVRRLADATCVFDGRSATTCTRVQAPRQGPVRRGHQGTGVVFSLFFPDRPVMSPEQLNHQIPWSRRRRHGVVAFAVAGPRLMVPYPAVGRRRSGHGGFRQPISSRCTRRRFGTDSSLSRYHDACNQVSRFPS